MPVTVNGGAVGTVTRLSAALAELDYNGGAVWPDADRSGTKLYAAVPDDDLTQTLYGTATGALTVDWGDGTEETVSSLPVSHTYAAAGAKTVTVTAADGVTWTVGQTVGETNYQVLCGSLPDEDSGVSNKCYMTGALLDGAVTGIHAYAFRRADDLLRVTIPETVTSIGEGAFMYSGLRSVAIPRGVTEIQSNAFCGCEDLVSAVLPDGLTQIGYSAFMSCASLADVNIPSGCALSTNAFRACTSLVNIEVNAESIGRLAFGDCTALEKVWLRDGAESIKGDAFFGCDGSCVLYAECTEAEKPDGWGYPFAYAQEAGTGNLYLTVVWAQSERPWSETELVSIAVTTQPTKTEYDVGDTLDLTGIVVTASYSDGTTADVTSSCTFSPANGSTLSTAGTQTVTASYTEDGVTYTDGFSVSVLAAATLDYIWDETTRTFTMRQTAATGTDRYSYDDSDGLLTARTSYEDTT